MRTRIVRPLPEKFRSALKLLLSLRLFLLVLTFDFFKLLEAINVNRHLLFLKGSRLLITYRNANTLCIDEVAVLIYLRWVLARACSIIKLIATRYALISLNFKFFFAHEAAVLTLGIWYDVLEFYRYTK